MVRASGPELATAGHGRPTAPTGVHPSLAGRPDWGGHRRDGGHGQPRARARPLGVEGGVGVSRAGLKSAGRARRGITLEDEGETRVLDGTTVQLTATAGASASVWAEASAGWLA